jgi:hypothetical protein
MTQSYESHTPPPGAQEAPTVWETASVTPPVEGSTSTSDVAKEQTRSVGTDAKEGGRHVADVAKEESRNVAEETKNQARDLWDQTRSELADQTGQQQQRVAGGLRSLGQELSSMANGSDQQGLASELAGRGADQAHKLAEYLDGRDPGALLDEVRRFARRRPGTFLAVAAGIGVAAGRMSRGMMPEHQDDEPARRPATATTTPAAYAPATSAARDTTERRPYGDPVVTSGESFVTTADPIVTTEPTGGEAGTWETRP